MSDIHIRIPREALEALLRALRIEPTRENGNGRPEGHQPHPPEPSSPFGDGWTDKQKRYLYRLVQKLGHEGDAARNYIRTALRLSPDEEPTRKEASELIDRLRHEAGVNGRGATP